MDYIAYTSLSATLLNVILVMVFNLLILKLTKIPFSGGVYAGLMTVLAFSFFGKNLINILPIYAGIWLYAIIKGHSFGRYYVIALFASGLSPIVSFGFGHGISYVVAGIVQGVLYGLVIPTLSAHMIRFHNGYTLYNIGFAGGIYAILAYGVIATFGFEYDLNNYVTTQHSNELLVFLVIISVYYIARSVGTEGIVKTYAKLLSMSGRAVTDFKMIFSKNIDVVTLNIGLLGLMCSLLLIILKVELNSLVFGGVITIMGFGSFGKHPRNVFPIILGVLFTAYVVEGEINSTIMIIAFFGTALAPIAGDFGFTFGLLAGALHYTLVTRTVHWQGGLNLYNNGFATGIVAAFLSSIIDGFDFKIDWTWKDKNE